MEAFATNTVINPFKWVVQVMILLDVKVNNLVAKAVYDCKWQVCSVKILC